MSTMDSQGNRHDDRGKFSSQPKTEASGARLGDEGWGRTGDGGQLTYNGAPVVHSEGIMGGTHYGRGAEVDGSPVGGQYVPKPPYSVLNESERRARERRRAEERASHLEVKAPSADVDAGHQQRKPDLGTGRKFRWWKPSTWQR